MVALTIARPHSTPGPFMRDFEAYYAAGHAWLGHDDPYGMAVWEHERLVPGVDPNRSEVLPFLGFPAFLPVWGLFATLPFAAAAALWATVTLALLLFAIFVMLKQLHARDIGSFLSIAAICIAFAPLTSAFALGQAALPSFALVVMATALLSSDPAQGAIATLLSALQPNIALVLISQVRYRSVAAVFGIVVLALITIGVVLLGAHEFGRYFSTLAAHGAAERHALIQFTPAAIAYGFGLPSGLSNALGIIVALAAAAVWFRMMTSRWATRWWRLAVTCALLPFVSPFFHEHDFVVLLVPVLMCLCASRRRIWAIAAAATVLVAVDWLGLAQRPDGIVQSALLVSALIGAIFALSDQPFTLHRFALLAALLLIPAGALAAHFPAPIWPDALPAHVTWIQPTLSATWHAQLQAAHELSPQPLWAALRLLTLIGAGALAWCSITTALRQAQDRLQVRA
ncbi:MAG: DUF2029 domain-containing protein [Candidatus Eremiobacteraeota bacterium]|nr:DUF2029 domain-containing protein [Candidatus Eremiobacteraeota bacterium]